jgi:hypothetical protein
MSPVALAQVVNMQSPTVVDDQVDVSLYRSTRARLEDAGLLDDPSGVAALLLAAQIDRAQDSGSSMAALAKQHAASLDEALSRRVIADDPIRRIQLRVLEKLADNA